MFMPTRQIRELREGVKDIIREIADAPSVFANLHNGLSRRAGRGDGPYLLDRALNTLSHLDEILDESCEGDDCRGGRYWIHVLVEEREPGRMDDGGKDQLSAK
jgi:hypothetical protein